MKIPLKDTKFIDFVAAGAHNNPTKNDNKGDEMPDEQNSINRNGRFYGLTLKELLISIATGIVIGVGCVVLFSSSRYVINLLFNTQKPLDPICNAITTVIDKINQPESGKTWQNLVNRSKDCFGVTK